AAYIEQQLQPETILDSEVEQRLASFQTLNMSSMQLLAAYPPPQLLRGIERRLSAGMGMDPEAEGTMFPELARRRERQEQRRRAGGDDATMREEDDSKMSPADRRAAQLERMGPGERMQAAMSSPQRIVIELSQAKLLRAIYSERQLQEVMTDFWFNHFNVFIGKGADRWLVTGYERDAIRPHALGNFRELLGATAAHPAMLFYLDNWLSADPKADTDERELRRRYFAYMQQQGIQPGALMLDVLRRRGMDTTEAEQVVARQLQQLEREERRGGVRGRLGGNQRRPNQQQQRRRGLNENYARELLELHTLGVEGGYTQQDVIEVARCFTGWTMLPLQFGQQFLYVDELHDNGTKTVLGQRIPNGGQRDGERVLDLLARHPSTARFISAKLARRFVSDEPPASLVEKMSRTFSESGGDIRAVLRTMLASEEFWSREAVAAKVKTPFEFIASAARASGAEVSEFPPGLVLALRELGQPLYAAQPPTGYKDTADAWVSTGGLLARMKVALGLASNRLPGVETELAPAWLRAASSEELVGTLSDEIVGRPLSEQTRAALAEELAQAQEELAAGGRMAEARLTLGWVLASPEFQRR
ncbi:MAG: DUF1800 domain-containing protein, partial [Candidatus Acidiferrales bacterium]